ncbi:Mss4-like protein [Ilyonectria destructans]|nr:Mss4-like protein [Ilyonectria destructans]
MNPKIQCQCGKILLYASRPEPLNVYCCHCLECQKQSSSAFGTSAIFPAEGMWPLPEDMRSRLGLWVRPTEAGNTLECYFCKECGVRILHRSILPDGTPKPTLSIKGGCLEGLSWEGAKHIYTRSAKVPIPEGGDPGSPIFDVDPELDGVHK